MEHVLAPGEIPVIPVDRGGPVTYHGPGQIVIYPLFDLRRIGVGVRELVNKIEQAIIDTLAHWNIEAVRREGAPGVYVADAKVAALGLRVRRGCSFHGLAFNVNMDLEPFHRINPCGYKDLAVTQVLDLGGPSRLVDVEDVLIGELCRQFGFDAEPAAPVIPELPTRVAV
jgi:lipoyl(octanoyl) transferase